MSTYLGAVGTPNVVVPYTSIHPATAAVTERARRVYVGEDDEAYWRLLRDLWRSANSFIIVEHDVAPTAISLMEMWHCPEAWCAVPYPMGAITTTALGCTKFSAILRARYPDLLAMVAPGQRNWNGLDGVVIGALHREGEVEHVHGPVAAHYHDDTTTRRISTMKLTYIGDGSRYIHEDMAIGLPGTPAADFETDNEVQIAVCLESGLYEEDTSGDTKAAKAQAKADAKEEKANAAARVKADAEAQKAVDQLAEAAAAEAAAVQAEAMAAPGHVPPPAEA